MNRTSHSTWTKNNKEWKKEEAMISTNHKHQENWQLFNENEGSKRPYERKRKKKVIIEYLRDKQCKNLILMIIISHRNKWN